MMHVASQYPILEMTTEFIYSLSLAALWSEVLFLHCLFCLTWEGSSRVSSNAVFVSQPNTSRCHLCHLKACSYLYLVFYSISLCRLSIGITALKFPSACLLATDLTDAPSSTICLEYFSSNTSDESGRWAHDQSSSSGAQQHIRDAGKAMIRNSRTKRKARTYLTIWFHVAHVICEKGLKSMSLRFY